MSARQALPRSAAFALFCICMLAVPGVARAHLMPAQQGTLNVVGDAVFVVLALPVAALRGVDDDGDGRLSPAELARHREALQLQLVQRFRLYDGTQAAAATVLGLSITDDDHLASSAAPGRQLVLLMRAGFKAPPQDLRVQTDLFGKTAAERQLTLKALRGGQTEQAVLNPSRSEHRYFFSAWQAGLQAVRTGAEYILLRMTNMSFWLARHFLR